MPKDPLVGVVILNWNRLDLTRQCLEALARQSFRNFTVIVIDNGSTDGSVKWLESQMVLLIKNPRNRGFARAINQGISRAIDLGCDYVVALNNDAIPNEDWLEQLVKFMRKNVDIGFAQGASMQEDDKDKYDSSGIYLESGFIPNQRALGFSEPRLDINAIGPNAAGAIYRTEMLRKIAIKNNEYFDGHFFAYVEDVDFNLRCTLRGYRFAFIQNAKMYHRGSVTGNRVAKRKMFWGARNMIWLVYKNASFLVVRRSLRSIIRSHLANLQFLWREQRANFFPYLVGLVVGLLGIPFFFLRRRENLKLQVLSDAEFLSLLTPSTPPLSNPFRPLRNLLK